MTQPLDIGSRSPAPGPIDPAGEQFWVPNLFDIPIAHNLSAFERNRLFLNRAGGWADASHLSGADLESDARGAVATDLNGDGLPDLLVRQAGGGPLRVFRNRLETTSNWVGITLADPGEQPIGARILVSAGGKTQLREVFPHNPMRSQHPLVQHLGLGAAEEIERLEVRWPSGRVSVLENLEANRCYRVLGASSPSEAPPRR